MIDARAELDKVRGKRELSRRFRYHRSKLDPFRCELVALRRIGATIAELAHWLQYVKFRKVAPSTVARYMARLPELQGAGQGVAGGESGSQL